MPSRIDPHVHASASECSLLTDGEFLAWSADHPDYFPVVSDHQTVAFHQRHRNTSGEAAGFQHANLFAVEITLGREWIDLILLTADWDAFIGLEQALGKLGRTVDPFSGGLDPFFGDDRTLVIWAHPREVEIPPPDWLGEIPVDFLEVNAARLAFQSTPERVKGHLHNLDIMRQDLFARHPMLIAGSDSHQAWTLGSTYNDFGRDLGSADEALAALRRGDFRGHVRIEGFHDSLLVDFDPRGLEVEPVIEVIH